jgi:hypothetical protein
MEALNFFGKLCTPCCIGGLQEVCYRFLVALLCVIVVSLPYHSSLFLTLPRLIAFSCFMFIQQPFTIGAQGKGSVHNHMHVHNHMRVQMLAHTQTNEDTLNLMQYLCSFVWHTMLSSGLFFYFLVSQGSTNH